MYMNRIGRSEIFTDKPEITSENIIEVVNDALMEHRVNADRIDFLLRYEAGEQPIKRTKTYRKEIDTKVCDNIANEITEFKLGFQWGYPITLVQRGVKDSGSENEAEAISLLNECYEAAGVKSETQRLARFIEIAGIGYTFVDVNADYKDGDSYIVLKALDPRCTFVIKSSYYIDHRPMVAVTFRTDSNGNTYYTAFTKTDRYEIERCEIKNGKKKETQWSHGGRSGEKNPLGLIPIIEWTRAYDRMGCFERQIPDMDALNILESDMINASSEQVDCIWHTNDVEFPKDDDGNIEHPQTGDWLQTFTSKNGKTPFVTALSINYDYAGNLNNVISKRALILQKCNVPQRNDNSGGSTGVAMSDATGWSAAEASACKQQMIIESCKMEEVKAVLAAIKICPSVKSNNPMKKLLAIDVKPNIQRQKTYELNNKVNAIATLINIGVNGEDVFKTIPLFEDPNQVWTDSKETIEKKQKSDTEPKQVVEKDPAEEANKDRLMQDSSDQNENSPVLDKE